MLRLFAAAAPPIAFILVGVLLLEPPALSPRDRVPTLGLLTLGPNEPDRKSAAPCVEGADAGSPQARDRVPPSTSIASGITGPPEPSCAGGPTDESVDEDWTTVGRDEVSQEEPDSGDL